MKAIRWSARAVEDLESLDPGIARRIRAGLLRYAETGSGDVIRLQNEGGKLRLRVGDWRILFEEAPAGNIHVQRVLHRSQAYR
ncbi:MAG: type II toxin-antitoxin system RelE/ParE family toxin [Bryobacteraceae bacterium]